MPLSLAGHCLVVSFTPFAKIAENHVKSFVQSFTDSYSDKSDIVTSYGVSSESTVDFSYGKKLISYLYSDYRDDGGAHGNISYSSDTMDMNGKKYELGDLFLPKTNYLGVISKIATAHFIEDPEINFDSKDSIWGDGLDPKIENFKTFTVSGEDLIFQLQDYQIGPYTSGSPTFQISVKDPEINIIIRPELF